MYYGLPLCTSCLLAQPINTITPVLKMYDLIAGTAENPFFGEFLWIPPCALTWIIKRRKTFRYFSTRASFPVSLRSNAVDDVLYHFAGTLMHLTRRLSRTDIVGLVQYSIRRFGASFQVLSNNNSNNHKKKTEDGNKTVFYFHRYFILLLLLLFYSFFTH